MMTNDNLRSDIVEYSQTDDMVFCDGFDDCLLGFVERFGMEPIAVYDKDKLLTSLEEQGMTRDEALEYFNFNIIGAWVGEYTPAFISFVPDRTKSPTE